MKRLFLFLLAVAAIVAGSVSCQKINDIDSRLTELERTVSDLKAQIAAGAVVTSVEKTEDGCIFTLSNGQSYVVTNGKDGSDGTDGEAIIADVKIEQDFIVLTLKDGQVLKISYQNPLSLVSLNIIPYYADGGVHGVIDAAAGYAFNLSVAVTPDKYVEALADMDRFAYKASFVPVQSKGTMVPGGLCLEAQSVTAGEGRLDVSFGLDAVAAQTLGNGSYAVSLSVEDKDGVHGAATPFATIGEYDIPDYLHFEAVEAGATVKLEIVGEVEAPSLEFSTDRFEWTAYDFSNPQTITLENIGDKVYWRNTGVTDHFSPDYPVSYIRFALGKKKIAAMGNVMSLIDRNCTSTSIPSESCFSSLFKDNASLVRAPQLPATELKPYCYHSMFYNCTALEKAPELPAEELAEGCYSHMFYYCSSLTEVSDIPATTVGKGSCFYMFYGCSSLKRAPALPAKQLGEYCYEWMFAFCTSLEYATELPATELAPDCYSMMFAECISLKEAPALPAMKMEKACYALMFFGCESLEEAPELPAMELADMCYDQMFTRCKSLKKAPALPATELKTKCYYEMFVSCSSIEEAPELPATKLADYCYYAMFAWCASITEAPALPATKLAEGCYFLMFQDCASLETVRELPAGELAYACYYQMFYDCTSLKEPPVLPATKLAEECYGEMFGYSGLTKAPELPATELVTFCYDYMFEGCESLEEAPYLPAKKLYPGCYEGLFEDCTNLRHIKVGFEDWGDGSATAGWVKGVAAEGLFECPEGLAARYGKAYIPAGWSVNGAAPAATKSLATQALALIDAESSAARNRKHSAPQELKPREISPLKPTSL